MRRTGSVAVATSLLLLGLPGSPSGAAPPVAGTWVTTADQPTPATPHVTIVRQVRWGRGEVDVRARLTAKHLIVTLRGVAPARFAPGDVLRLQRYHPAAKGGVGAYSRSLGTTKVRSGNRFTLRLTVSRTGKYRHGYRYRLGAVGTSKGLTASDTGWSGIHFTLDTRDPVTLDPVVAGNLASLCNFAGSLNDFYTAPDPVPAGAPGTILRCQEHEPIKNMTGAHAYRIMFLTQAPAPSASYAAAYQPGVTPLVNRISTGVVFVPDAPAPDGGRKVVAWDHPTVGMGQQCAPSISGFQDLTPVTPGSKPTQYSGWIQNMINQNWLVTAPDYAGLGLIGQSTTLQYLVGPSEAMDTANAVRAAIAFPGAGVTAPDYAIYGHSQGGHAALFAASINPLYAPELHLRAATASDPAAQMNALLAQSWNTRTSWVLGPEVVTAWPQVNTALMTPAAAWKALARDQIVTEVGRANYQAIAGSCITGAMERALVLPGPFFSQAIVDPADATGALWRAMADQQTPPPPAGLPIMVGQTTNDGIVLANTTALLQQNWCAAGVDLSMFWVDQGTGGSSLARSMAHMTSAWSDALAAVAFINDAFTGASTAPVTPCTVAPPAGITPYGG